MIYKEFRNKKISILEKISLLFVRSQRSVEHELGFDVLTVYKTLRGVVYIINQTQLPPSHFNCRCWVAAQQAGAADRDSGAQPSTVDEDRNHEVRGG